MRALLVLLLFTANSRHTILMWFGRGCLLGAALLLCAFLRVSKGDGVSTLLSQLKPHEVALMQYDSRVLGDYWLTAALWNQAYADRHGHLFIYYTLGDEHVCAYGVKMYCSLVLKSPVYIS